MVFQGTNRRGCSSVQRMQPVWAAVFDWDGVILDSSRHHEESWERLAKEAGKLLPHEHFRK